MSRRKRKDSKTHKECRCCNQVKPKKEFNKNSIIPDGLSLYCRECVSAKAKAYRAARYDEYREAERASAAIRKDEIKAYHKVYYAKPKIKKKMKKYYQEYRKNNPELMKKIQRKFYMKHRERILKEKAEKRMNSR